VREKVSNVLRDKTLLKNLLVPFSFILPVFVFYLLDPNSFVLTWKGRAFYVFFIWLACLELALSWKKLSTISFKQLGWFRLVAAVAFMIVPTVYALAIFSTGLNQLVIELGRFLGVPQPLESGYGSWILYSHWPLSFEYMVFALCFSLSVFFMYSKEGIRKLSIALFFLWAIAFFYTVDTFLPFGRLWILQIFVPFTAGSSATVLNWLGYRAITIDLTDPFYVFGTMLVVFQNSSTFAVTIFWASAGVHSMLIYTLTILLFIKNAVISLKRKIAIFVVGAVGTFVANVLRIVAICIIGLRVGSTAAQHFHDYYGEFFFISWMLLYIAIIVFGPKIVAKILKRQKEEKVVS